MARYRDGVTTFVWFFTAYGPWIHGLSIYGHLSGNLPVWSIILESFGHIFGGLILTVLGFSLAPTIIGLVAQIGAISGGNWADLKGMYTLD